MSEIDKTALSYWFPKLVAAGLPVPRTIIVRMDEAARESITAGFDGQDDAGNPEAFFAEIEAAAQQVGYPFFLRTDHTSDKHSWKRSCFVPGAPSIASHVFRIAETSELVGFPCGLPWDVWAVREMLPTIPRGVCPRYGDMPINREFRFFVDDGHVRCSHPYWPRAALVQGGSDVSDVAYAALCEMPAEAGLHALAEAAGRAVGGSWSVDILETRDGWKITDMAEADKSFHWPGCEAAL